MGKPDAEARSLEGEVRIVEHLGNSTIVHVETPAGAVVVEADGNARARPGDLVGLTFEEVEGHLFSADGQAV